MAPQVWLLLHNLLADGAARAGMGMTEARCDALLRLRRHFNELLFDQVGGSRAGEVEAGMAAPAEGSQEAAECHMRYQCGRLSLPAARSCRCCGACSG